MYYLSDKHFKNTVVSILIIFKYNFFFLYDYCLHVFLTYYTIYYNQPYTCFICLPGFFLWEISKLTHDCFSYMYLMIAFKFIIIIYYFCAKDSRLSATTHLSTKYNLLFYTTFLIVFIAYTFYVKSNTHINQYLLEIF